MMIVGITVALLLLIFLMDFLRELREFRKEYRRKTAEEPQVEWRQLDDEAGRFLNKVRGRSPRQWTLGELAWYESIRRRESLA